RVFNVIGFQRQDVQNYVYAYFRNIDNYQANVLIDIFDNNPSLKLLSHTPLYLRLFCYLARQQMNEIEEEKKEYQIKDKLFDGLNGISLSKLYEKLLVCYMKWNWTKWNKTKDKPNEQTMFDM
ncbi:hypothetical protein RFI_29114, partial [Reticulomyxa filosa]